MGASLSAIQTEYKLSLQDATDRLEKIVEALAAADVFTLTGNATDGSTVTIGGKVYTFQAVLTDVDGHVKLGAGAAASLTNLIAAVNLGPGAGSLYAASTTLHPTVGLAQSAGTTVTATAKTTGAAGNLIAVSDTVVLGSWATPTLTGGSDSGTVVRDRAISEAMKLWYSRFLPYKKTVLLATSADAYYAVPADWNVGYSRILSIEYPLDQQPPSVQTMQSKGIIFQDRETGLYYYLSNNPAGSYRLTYLAAHPPPVGDDYATVRAEHEPMIGKRAAMLALQTFANYFKETESQGVDAINYRTKAQECMSLAEKLRMHTDAEMKPEAWKFYTQQNALARYNKPWRG